MKIITPFFYSTQYLVKMLTFTTTKTHLNIGGKTFYAKEEIKALGGKWDPISSSWTLPIDRDTEDFRKQLQEMATSAEKAVKKKEREERKAEKEYAASPEGMAATAAAKKDTINRCFEEKQKTGAYWWLCCAECEVVDWKRKHTNCMKCAEWDGYCWNSFRVNGSIFTGD